MGNDIGWAMAQLWDGKKVRRRGWNGVGMWLQLVGHTVDTRAYVAISPPDGLVVPWVCSQTDLLGGDWELAE